MMGPTLPTTGRSFKPSRLGRGPLTPVVLAPGELESDSLKTLYSNRFSAEAEQRQDIWQVLCSDFFQRWVPRDATVLDLAGGKKLWDFEAGAPLSASPAIAEGRVVIGSQDGRLYCFEGR